MIEIGIERLTIRVVPTRRKKKKRTSTASSMPKEHC